MLKYMKVITKFIKKLYKSLKDDFKILREISEGGKYGK